MKIKELKIEIEELRNKDLLAEYGDDHAQAAYKNALDDVLEILDKNKCSLN